MGNRWGIPKDVETLVLNRDTVCVYCGVVFGEERRTKRSWEHIVNDVRLSSADNVALCCIGCNASKGAKLLQVWLMSDRAKKRGGSEGTIAPVVRDALRLAYHAPSLLVSEMGIGNSQEAHST